MGVLEHDEERQRGDRGLQQGDDQIPRRSGAAVGAERRGELVLRERGGQHWIEQRQPTDLVVGEDLSQAVEDTVRIARHICAKDTGHNVAPGAIRGVSLD